MFAGITQKGIEFGVGKENIDGFLQANFCYLAADTTYSALSATLSPNVEYRIIRRSHVKLYASCGMFFRYARYAPAYLDFTAPLDIHDDENEVTVGINVFSLRPEVMIFDRISLFAHLPIMRYEFGTQIGGGILLINGIANTMGYDDGIPSFGVKMYF
jgi:hypothetical protein